MNSRLLVPAIGLTYIVVFGFLFWLRREGLPLRFATEGVILTALGTLGAFTVGVGPISFLIVLYLITMRTRILADLGNFLVERGHIPEAMLLFDAANRLVPDSLGKMIVGIDRGVALVRLGELKESVNVFQSILDSASIEMPVRYLAAAHYNLGLAYMHLGDLKESRKHFLAVLDIAPETVYAIGAQTGLRKQTQMPHKDESSSSGENTGNSAGEA